MVESTSTNDQGDGLAELDLVILKTVILLHVLYTFSWISLCQRLLFDYGASGSGVEVRADPRLSSSEKTQV